MFKLVACLQLFLLHPLTVVERQAWVFGFTVTDEYFTCLPLQHTQADYFKYVSKRPRVWQHMDQQLYLLC